MMPEIWLIGAVVLLWLAVYVSKRRFGVLGLGLIAGVMLGSIWQTVLADRLVASGASFGGLSINAMTQIGLILLPPIILLFGGPIYRHRRDRMLGSLLFVGFALTLVAQPLSELVTSNLLLGVNSLLQPWQVYTVTFCSLVALFDILRLRKLDVKR